MKKKKEFMEESMRQSLKDYCDATENVEKDKDMFLKASRLERYEKKPLLNSSNLTKEVL